MAITYVSTTITIIIAAIAVNICSTVGVFVTVGTLGTLGTLLFTTSSFVNQPMIFFFHFTVITLSVADSVHLDTRRHILSLQGFHKFLNIPTRLTVKTEVTLFSIKSYVLGLQIFLMGGAWIDFLFDKQTIIWNGRSPIGKVTKSCVNVHNASKSMSSPVNNLPHALLNSGVIFRVAYVVKHRSVMERFAI